MSQMKFKVIAAAALALGAARANAGEATPQQAYLEAQAEAAALRSLGLGLDGYQLGQTAVAIALAGDGPARRRVGRPVRRPACSGSR